MSNETISVFPDPRPDEALCSVGGRFQDLFRFQPKNLATQRFFGSDAVKVVVDLPSHLGVLHSRLPDGNRYTVDGFIANNTMLPLYAFFLPIERVHLIQREMIENSQQNLQLLAGILSCHVKTPDYFVLCSKCVDEDRGEYGSCHFHRSHHAPGVRVCSKHSQELLQTTLLTKGRREFVSAESAAIHLAEMKPLHVAEPNRADFLALAQDIFWLLNTPFETPGPDAIRKRYLTILIEKGFASPTGHVKTTQLIKAFQSRFDAHFLEELNCEIEGHYKRNWIARIVQSNQPQHPIRHLLFIRFLGYTIEEFYKCPTEYLPFGTGPWPCLNTVCNHYLEPVIESLFSGFTRKVSRRPLGTFQCPDCGFTYVRTGPDKEPSDRLKRTKIITYGNVWNTRLRHLWSDTSHYLRDIADELGVNQSTVYEQAKRLKLGQRGTIEIESDDPDIDLLSIVDTCRKQWLSALNEFPTAGTAQLIGLVPQIYSTLDRLDYNWLNAHKPERPNGNQTLLIDWSARDIALSTQAPLIAERLKTQLPTQRVTLNAIAIELGWGEGSIQRDIEHLPISAEILPSFLETHEDFAFRRIQTLIEVFIKERAIPSRSDFMKRAGLNPAVKTPRILNAVDEALALIHRDRGTKNVS